MASAEVQNRGDQPKVRFSSIQYHEATPLVEEPAEFHLPKQLPSKQYLKYAQFPSETHLEGLRTTMPVIDSKLNVDHQHYEQWARVPTKRVTNSILLRGIQQLKARTKREALEEEGRAYSGVQSRNLQSRELPEVSLKDVVLRESYNRDGFSRLGSTKDVRFGQNKGDYGQKDLSSKDGQQKVSLQEIRVPSTKDRDKTEAKVTRVCLKFKTIENPDNKTESRQHLYLPSAVSDAVTNKPPVMHKQAHNQETVSDDHHRNERETAEAKHVVEVQPKSDSQIARELMRSRYGMQKLRERSPFPVSIKQPKYYGEPVFLVHDPYKHRELPKSKSRMDMMAEARAEALSQGLNGIRHKLEFTEIRLPGDAASIQDDFYRSKSFVASFPSKKQPNIRTPAQVPSADFCDISQLEDTKPRHSAYASLLERSRTDSAFSCKNPNLLKWVPRVQRMKELLK